MRQAIHSELSRGLRSFYTINSFHDEKKFPWRASDRLSFRYTFAMKCSRVGIVSPLMFLARRPTAFIYALLPGPGPGALNGPSLACTRRDSPFHQPMGDLIVSESSPCPGPYRFCAIATTLAVCPCGHLRVRVVGGLSSPKRRRPSLLSREQIIMERFIFSAGSYIKICCYGKL